METLNYIGCKNKLFERILQIIKDNVTDIKNKTFADLFAGTGTISYNMQSNVSRIISNDLEYYSFVINNALVKCEYSDKLSKLIGDMNNLQGVKGLVYENYSPVEGKCDRCFFTPDNAQKCDAARQFINDKFAKGEINEFEKYFLIASLLVSIDKVANTTSVYGAYLKKFKASALKKLTIIPIHTKTDIKTEENQVFNQTCESLIKDTKFSNIDIVYLDPPYNQRQYSANYAPLNYIAKYDDKIVLKGKTGLIDGYNRSYFSSKTLVKETFETTIKNINAKWIFISYNNEGILSVDDLKSILLSKGSVKLYNIKYNRYKSNSKTPLNDITEYLWCVEVNQSQTTGQFQSIDLE